MHWEDIPAVVDQWVEKAAAPGFDVRQTAARVITASHVGYYFDPITDRVGIFAPSASTPDAARVKSAAHRAFGSEPLFLTYPELQDPTSTWVKVAHSPTLRRAGELLNFFPGQLPGGLPNAPSPVAAMLTSGLLGAGLGWGAGKLIGKAMPKGYGDRLSRTGLLLGGALGAAPGLMWGGVNKLDGRSFNDPALLNGHPGQQPFEYGSSVDGANAAGPPTPLDAGPTGASQTLEGIQHTLHESPIHRLKFGEDLGVELGAMWKAASEKAAETFGHAEPHYGHLPTDVNIDALGRTLWDTGAPPSLAATTMAGMYAAQQLPDRNARPGWATGHQLGQLAANAAGDYAQGYLAGAAINAAIGTPFSAPAFGAGAAVLGVLGAVVPKLFGR